MVTSKITSRTRTTIPKAVRIALGLKQDDRLVYLIKDGMVTLTKYEARVPKDPFPTFTEWDSDADRTAYRQL